MHIAAIHSLGPDRETHAAALASALDITMYEALSRLRSPGNGPFTIGVFADQKRAMQVEEKLRSSGFSAVVLTEAEIIAERTPLIARKFDLSGNELAVATETGQGLRISFENIRLLLRGIGIVRGTTTETVKNRSLSLGRAVMSSGLMITRTTKTVQEIATEERTAFFNLYAEGSQVVVFRESGLLYDSLGPALQPSRALNFAYLIAELRRLAPDAQYDERLLTRPAQIALLGPTLNPEEHLSEATALLAKTLSLRP
ncbi:MAG: hypothetical protein Q8K68_02035 [Nitrospirota bacterium]|nr:hypothetical protein [Nitrospirota bacterium]